jgi:hypothetical protein
MKLHNEKVIYHKSEMDLMAIPETTTAISLPNQSDDDYHVTSKNDEWSSSDEGIVKFQMLSFFFLY